LFTKQSKLEAREKERRKTLFFMRKKKNDAEKNDAEKNNKTIKQDLRLS